MSNAADFELLLRQALTPVDPPADMPERIEATLVNLTEMAADELEAWELSAMRDPRNWVRPAAAVVVGTTAGAALVVLRARQRRRRGRPHAVVDAAEQAIKDVYGEARKFLPKR
ncbi:MAG TPA: hypothetical protein VGN78_15140 [Solirubrobacteraceae bacterium]|nr:hypothetical protein [Solirubrobacteraceae bacterium]